ncbi:YfjI family protein [Streptomyces sp. NPDC005840]|uniref:YfjI family protein n=1 Tax=Streptomyces sp. NPDC005840 TaxID=3157072 RepID=UPI0033EC1D79
MNSTTTPLSADQEVVRSWLTHLYAGCPGFISICSDKDGWVGRRFATDENGIEAAVQYALELDRRRAKGVYAQSTTLSALPSKRERGGEDLAHGLTHLWADGDYGTFGHSPGPDDLPAPPDADSVAKVVHGSGLPTPSGWVHSGGGYNPVWMLNENHLIDDSTRARIKEITTGLQAVLAAEAYRHGWSWDIGVGNLDRLMKIPGTVNRKKGLDRPTAIGPGTGAQFALDEIAARVTELLPAARQALEQATAEQQQRRAQRTGAPDPPPKRSRPPGLHTGDGPLDVLADMLTFRDLLEPEGWTYVGQSGGREKWLRPTAGGEGPSSAYSLVCDDHVAVNWSERSDLPVGALPAGQKLTVGTLWAHLHYSGNTSEAARDIKRAAAGRAARGPAGHLPGPVLAEVKRRCLADEERRDEAPQEDMWATFNADEGAQSADWTTGVHPGDSVGWDEPMPLAPPAPLPLDAARLRGIGVMAEAVANSLQVPVDLPALLGLSAASTAIGGRRAVSPKPDWTEPVTLYTMPVAAPGEMKSPALSLMGKPIYAEEKRRREADKVAVVKDRRNRKMVESAVAEAENRVIKARDSASRANAKLNLDAVYSELEELGDPLVHTQLVADDTTPEAAVDLIAEQGERLAILSTEGSFLGNVGGRYSKNANPEIVLKAWSHETHSVNRKSGPPVLLERPNLSLGLAVQPGFLTGMGETGDVFEARGLMARFIFAMPTSRVGDRSYDSDPIPPEVSAAYNSAVVRLMQAVHDDPEYRVMSLDAAAQELFRSFWEALEPRHRAHGDLATVEGWAKKLPGQVLRIAAVLALYEEPTTLIVKGEVMGDAISLVPYLIQHARLVADLMSEERQSKLGPARAVLDWIRRADQRGRFAAKDVEKAVRGQKWCTAMEDVDAALGVLEDAGWVRRIEPPPRPEGARGRPPKARFVAHPDTFTAERR